MTPPHSDCDKSNLLETNLGAVQLLEHVLVQHFHERANAGGLLQPAVLQLRPDVGERSSEAFCVGDLMHALIEGDPSFFLITSLIFMAAPL